jgi:hypothetical protein
MLLDRRDITRRHSVAHTHLAVTSWRKNATHITVKWPWLAFSSYSAGNEDKTGKLWIGENNAQFQNVFGAWEHVRL